MSEYPSTLEETASPLTMRLSPYLGVIPYAIFVVGLVIMALNGVFDMVAVIVISLLGLVVGMLFSRSVTAYWEAARAGVASYGSSLVALLYLFVGIYAALIELGDAAGGLIWLGVTLGLTGTLFTAFTFLAGAVFATSTGTSFGTLAVMTVSFFPAGVALGADPALLAGALLSGAAFGDNISPVSDTTIISATLQRYRRTVGSADIGGVVRSRLKYALIAGAAAFVLYLVIPGNGTVREDAAVDQIAKEFANPAGLLMLIPVAALLLVLLLFKNVFLGLLTGIATAITVGIASGSFAITDVFRIDKGDSVLSSVDGAAISGVTGVLPLVIFFLLVFALTEVLTRSGALELLLNTALRRIGRSPRRVELSSWALVSGANLLTAGGPTFVVALMGPVVDVLGGRAGIHPYRRANLVDGLANTLGYILPFGIMTLIGFTFIDQVAESSSFVETPELTSALVTTFHPWALLIVFGVAAATGLGRTYEGEGGRVERRADDLDIEAVERLTREESDGGR